MSPNFFTMASLATIACVMVPMVSGHGWMMDPAGRQLEECNGEEATSPYKPDGGLGGGGSPDTFDRGGYPPPCGDPFNHYDLEENGSKNSNFINMPCTQMEPQVYTEGGVMDITWYLKFNHGGFLGCSVCDDLNDMSEDCFAKNELLTVEHASNRSYILTGYDDTKQPSLEWTSHWQLPDGLTCEHCAVSCTWWTAHGCMYDCDREVCGFYADRQNPFKRYKGSELYNQPVDKMCDTLWAEPLKLPQVRLYLALRSFVPQCNVHRPLGKNYLHFLPKTNGV